jgi:hypothetical protein
MRKFHDAPICVGVGGMLQKKQKEEDKNKEEK